MPANPWLAIDAATSPRRRARELKRLWERFVGDGKSGAVRPPIADSWRRSHEAGVDPSGEHLAPVLADEEETSARLDVHPLAAALPLIEDSLTAIADESAHLIVVSDADGLLLWIGGNARVRMAAADSMNFTEGALWSENGAGTNAIGTALAADHAVQVFAAEHFNEIVQSWTCAAAPVHDPDTGRLLGIVDLTGKMTTVHPHSLALATTTAKAVEAQLRWAMHERDDRLRARYHERIATVADPRALVTLERAGAGRPSRRVAAGATARAARRRRRARAGFGDARIRGARRPRGGLHRSRGRHEGRSATSSAAEADPAGARPRRCRAGRATDPAQPPPLRGAGAAVDATGRDDERGAGRRSLRGPRDVEHHPGRGPSPAQASRPSGWTPIRIGCRATSSPTSRE